MRRLLSALFGSNSQRNRAETGDQEVALDRALDSMERQLADAEASLLAVAEARRQLERRKDAHEKMVVLRTRQAERAATVGRDDLARRALSLRNDAEREASQMESGIREVVSQMESLAAARDSLRQRIDQLRSRRVEMGARLTAAEAQLQLRDAAASAAVEAAEASRLSERLAEGAAVSPREPAGASGNVPPGRDDQEEPLEREIRELERERRVEAELRRLKREALAERGALDAGDEGREP
jgi:phage shock protein A